MPSRPKGYIPLQPGDVDLGEDEQYKSSQPRWSWTSPIYNINIILLTALFVSVTTNLVLGLLYWPLKDLLSQNEHATMYGKHLWSSFAGVLLISQSQHDQNDICSVYA